MLYSKVVEVEERVGARGEVVMALNEHRLEADFRQTFAAGYRSIAIVFTHGYRYPEHERRAAELARAAGFTQVSVSHVVSPLMKLVGRGDTTVVDAYLSPILRRYVDRLAGELGGVRLLMQSNGGLTDARRFQGKDAILWARPAASSARFALRPRRASTASSASTWAARRPTYRTTPGSSSASSRPA